MHHFVWQVNSAGAEKLYSLAGDWAGLGPDTLLFDVCCGTGAIGLTLAKRVGMVCHCSFRLMKLKIEFCWPKAVYNCLNFPYRCITGIINSVDVWKFSGGWNRDECFSNC